MVDATTIWLADANSTHSSGKSLVQTLYGKSLTIGLNGDLGAGKTTFLQGFFEGLGVVDDITSPTYALEQRYSSLIADIIHIDLYRLEQKQAAELLSQTDDFEGIRCIEWVEKAGTDEMCDILITLKDATDGGRDLTVEYRDMTYPTIEQIHQWREDMSLPSHICNHCDAVADFALSLATDMMKTGSTVRTEALHRSGLIHDLMRFVDFKPGPSNGYENSEEERSIWNTWKLQYPGLHHEESCAAFLEEHGHTDFASIVRTHGLGSHAGPIETIEQKLLFYADKRVAEDKIVTLQERFDDFTVRYGSGEQTDQALMWLDECKELEKELLL
jgi:tRNA threonylcarbamoyladenosine biosynthesis protein TsaE